MSTRSLTHPARRAPEHEAGPRRASTSASLGRSPGRGASPARPDGSDRTRWPPSRLLLAVGVLFALACARGPSAAGTPSVSASSAGVPAAAMADPKEPKYAATEILISHVGAVGATAGTTRTEPEARARIDELWRRATAGEPLEGLAREASDGTEAARGGKLGTWRVGTMVPELERAVAALEVGAISAPFHSAFGWHLVRRDPVLEIGARQVFVTYSGAWRSGSTRSKEAARQRIQAALAELDGGADFAAVAAKYSDDATAKTGGDLGTITPGQLVPAFEDAAFGLAVGQRSGVVETPYGFHLIERTR